MDIAASSSLANEMKVSECMRGDDLLALYLYERVHWSLVFVFVFVFSPFFP